MRHRFSHITVMIRFWGGLPEGVMYSILLMNSATPLLTIWTRPRALGEPRRRLWSGAKSEAGG